MAWREGFEPPIYSLEGCCIIRYATARSILVPRAGIEPARPFRKARDFKSLVSTYFTTEAV